MSNGLTITPEYQSDLKEKGKYKNKVNTFYHNSLETNLNTIPSTKIKEELCTTKQGIAVLLSLSTVTLVGLAAILYGVIEETWISTGGGGGLMSLVLYEINRFSKM